MGRATAPKPKEESYGRMASDHPDLGLFSTGGPFESFPGPVLVAGRNGIVLGAMYLVGLGIASFGASTWAWVSLRSGIERPTRRLNIAQFVVALPGVLIGVLVATWLAGQGIS